CDIGDADRVACRLHSQVENRLQSVFTFHGYIQRAGITCIPLEIVGPRRGHTQGIAARVSYPAHLLRARPSGAITIRERLMFYTRRDIGKIAVAASGGARLLAAQPNSVIGGVRI